MRILKEGDTIQWDFKGDIYSGSLKNKTFTAKIVMVNEKEKYYGVYAEYGQDLIPFNSATLIR